MNMAATNITDNRRGPEWQATKKMLHCTRGRMIFICAAFWLSYGVVSARLIQLTCFPHMVGQNAQSLARPPTLFDDTAQPQHAEKRGRILDRNGQILATSLKTASLYADAKYVIDAKDAATKLVQVLPDLAYGDVLQKLQSKKRFVWLKRYLTPKQMQMVNALGLPGIDFYDEYKRIYPNGNLAAHIVGFTDVDNQGIAGVEKHFNKTLGAEKQDITLSVDLRVQHILTRELQKYMTKFEAIGAAGMVMNAKSGEIYAMASLPDYNANNPNASPVEFRFNRILNGVYEMGSTFKTFATAAAIEFAKVPLSEKFNVSTPLRRGGFTISDFHPENHPMATPEIYIKSSNIGTVQLAERVGTPQMKLFFQQLGLTSRQAIDGEITAAPLVPNPWQDISTITAAYGHGIAVTPLHLAAATATIINNGHVTKPTLVKQPAGTNREDMGQQLISDQTSDTVRKLMRLVVSDGTGSKADINGFEVGGKTGTAEKTLGRGYAEKSLLSSFVGAFPMDDPQFVIVAFVDEPKGQKESYGFATGGWVAAPVVGTVIKEMSPLLGIRPKISHDLNQLRASMGLAPKT